ncbi:MAG: GNAT family N-acetyltransferase [Candidatus Eisenbacteria bacterium]|nr:GNAT family N-acetyltransferase [Candidatus Eisenbacteria bacterium]
MDFDIRPLDRGDPDLIRPLITHPSLAPQFDILQPPGALEDWLGDPHMDCGPEGASGVAYAGGRPVGLVLAFALNGLEGPWGIMRPGVLGEFRRRGIGSALVRAAEARLLARKEPAGELCLSAWLVDVPASPGRAEVPFRVADGDPAPAFAARHGYSHARYFWLMDRPRGAAPELTWPAGIVTRTFDGSEQAIADWCEAYNDSFAEHYHFMPGTLEDTRRITGEHGFHADGLMLAYRDGRCVGYCRNKLDAHAGEVALLGTVRAARGIGLGRALLRWGVGWLEEKRAPSVTLMVDGDNENALALYRSENFEVARTREIWSRRP